MHKKRAQFSLEYMMVIAFVMVLFMPALAVLMGNSADSDVEFSRLKVNVLANNILDEAKTMYYSGGYAKRSIKYILPDRVEAFYLSGENNDSLVFEMQTPLGKRDMVFFSQVPLQFPYPIIDSNNGIDNKIVNLDTIYLLKNESDVLICTNLNIEGPCLGLAEEPNVATPIICNPACNLPQKCTNGVCG